MAFICYSLKLIYKKQIFLSHLYEKLAMRKPIKKLPKPIPLSERNLPPGVLKSILQQIREKLVESKKQNAKLNEK